MYRVYYIHVVKSDPQQSFLDKPMNKEGMIHDPKGNCGSFDTGNDVFRLFVVVAKGWHKGNIIEY